ncbi:MAG: DUF1800 family protein [Planctomycetota bacterium]
MQRRRLLGLLAGILFALGFVGPAQISSAGDFEVTTRTEMIDLMLRIRADQFLRRATFGPTDDEITTLVDEMRSKGVIQACTDWIDAQFALPATSHQDRITAMLAHDNIGQIEPGKGVTNYRDHAFWDIVINSPDQLKQRIAWALIQIVTISNQGSNFNNAAFSDQENELRPFYYGPSNYYDMLLENADDTYREILTDVTRHPVMGVYLSHVRNKKADPVNNTFPDENYAREIMQLFSVGLYKMTTDGTFLLDSEGERIPTYDNETIKEMARLFTGLTYADNTNINFGRPDLMRPMIMIDSSHDFGAKTLLDGQVLPPSSDGLADIEAGLDLLYAHPNVAPFISKLLIQRFVRPNPSRAYLNRVSNVFNDNGSGVKGDLKAVVKAILLDREAWQSISMRRLRNPTRISVRGAGTEMSRLVEPVVKYAGWLRRYADDPEFQRDGSGSGVNGVRMRNMADQFSQSPYRSPTVFNFYLPTFQPTGPITSYTASRRIPNRDLFAPEFQIMTSVIYNKMANRYRWETNSSFSQQQIVNADRNRVNYNVNLDFSRYNSLASDPKALVQALDLDLCGGTLSQTATNALIDAIEDDNTNNVDNIVRAAITCLIMSPDGAIVE